MNPNFCNSAKNFYSFTANAYSTDNLRPINRSPTGATQPAKYSSSIYSSINNMQNLQSLKNQIYQLQTALTTSQQRRSNKNSQNNTKDKSFYSLIKEQLKHVNQLQSGAEIDQPFANKINKRPEPTRKLSSPYQPGSKQATPKGSVQRNQSLVVENPKSTALKSLLSSHGPQNKENKDKLKFEKVEEKCRTELQNSLKILEKTKQDKLLLLKEEFTRRKNEIETDYQELIQNEIQQFEIKLKRTMEKRKSETLNNKIKRKSSQLQVNPPIQKHLQSASLSSSDSSIDKRVKCSYNILYKLAQTEKTHLVSSLKKDSSLLNKEKKHKVRFETDIGNRFKTDNDNSRLG